MNLPNGLLEKSILSNPPNVRELYAFLQDKYHLESEDAREVIYQVVLRLNTALFPSITKMELILTEGCNLACKYCFEKNMRGYRKMPIDIARTAVDLLFDYAQDENKLHITHFGGEPALNFEAIQHVTEYAEDKASRFGKSITFSITSNGVLLNRAMITYFAEHKIKVLLSVDGLENTHNSFREDKHGHGTFKKVAEVMQILKETQPWIGVRMTVMPENVQNLFDDILGLYGMGVNQFIIAHATGIKWSDEDIESYCTQFRKLFEWYTKEHRQDLRIYHFEKSDKGSNFFGCQAGRNSISVSPNGEISPCSKVLALNNNHLLAKLGDVTNGLTYINNRLELMRCSQLQASCEAKGIAADFEGECFASNYEENKDLFQPVHTLSWSDIAFGYPAR